MCRKALGWCSAVVAMSALGLGGCQTVQGLATKPQVQSVAVVVSGFDLHRLALRFEVELRNPGDGELSVRGYDYELQVEGRPLTTGTSRDSFVLAPRGTARVVVPVAVALADLRHALAALDRRGEVAYRLTVTVLIDTPLGAFRFPLEKAGCLSVFPPAVRSCPPQS